jgi:hypothetical protein
MRAPNELTIWKYQLSFAGNVIKLPKHHQILSVQVQHSEPVMWVLQEPTGEGLSDVAIHIVGTGHSIPQDVMLEFVDTFQLNDGNLVFHVFKESRVETKGE